MVTMTSASGHTAYGLRSFICDTAADVDDLPVDTLPGSSAFVIETCDVYILNSKGEWRIIE